MLNYCVVHCFMAKLFQQVIGELNGKDINEVMNAGKNVSQMCWTLTSFLCQL